MESDDKDVDGNTSITHDFGVHIVTVSTITDEDMAPALDPIKVSWRDNLKYYWPKDIIDSFGDSY